MVETVRRRGRRRAGERMAAAAASYAAMGWPVCAGAHPPGRPHRGADAGRACSCDRMGCPAPGAHPMSPAWQVEATTDPATVWSLWPARPERSEEHTSELQSRPQLVCRLLLEKKTD